MKMKYLLTILLCSLFQLPLFAELVIDIDPEKAKDEKKTTPVDNNQVEEENIPKFDVLRFKNNDVLHGKMLSFDPGKGFLWKTTEALRDITFIPRNVKKVDLGAYRRGRGGNASVLLTNGDTLGGKLVSLDKDTLTLDTFYGGILKINRPMIQAIYPGESNTGVLYSGPSNMENWTRPEGRSGGKVSIKDGVLSMTGYCALGRDMKLTDMVKIDFDFQIAGNCQLQVLFYCDEVVGSPQNCYALYLSSGYIYLQRYGRHGRSGNLGNVNCRDLRAGKGKITLLLDKKNRKFTLLVNGNMIKQWVDTQDIKEGTFFCFNNQSQGTIKIRNLEISQWNGKIPGGEKSKEDEQKDVVIFVNGDQVTGNLLTIANNETVFKTEYAELKVPLSRIKQLQTASKNQFRARRNAGDAQLLFANGDKLTLDLQRIADGKIKGKSENFGQVSLALNAFKGLELNIYDDEEEEE